MNVVLYLMDLMICRKKTRLNATRYEFILMNQGEHDLSGNTSRDDYLAGLRTLVENYRTDLDWDVPFLYCQLGPAYASSWDDSRNSVMTGIRAAQLEANDPDNGVLLAAVEMDLARNADNLHYTTQSLEVIGERVANTIFWYYDENPDIHVGGMQAVLQNFDVQTLLTPDLSETDVTGQTQRTRCV